MVGQKKDRGAYSRGELVLWGFFLAVGCYLLVVGVIPATQAERDQTRQLQRLQETTQDLTTELNRLNLEEAGLAEDPDLIEQRLRNRGYTPEGAIRVIADPASGR